MDYERAEKTLADYVTQVRECQEQAQRSPADPQAPVPQLRMPARRVNQTLGRLTPDAHRVTGVTLSDHTAALCFVEQAQDVISASRQIDGAQAENGSPVLPMTVLDPLVYQAAIKHWKHGHYRIAVGEAATNVDRYTQRRLQRWDVFGASLMEAAFSTAPPQPGKPRLRCPCDQADDTVRSQQTGALNYAKACFMAMRNPAHHQKGDWNPFTAFHHVVSLSQVALWVRNWNLVSYVPPETKNG
jgi:Protein of unknown function (Hypoth_ymh)